MIIFIDDELNYISAFIQAFEMTGFSVETEKSIDQAWEKISNNPEAVDAIILDIMMPHGRLFTFEETEGGLNTGLMFIEKMIELDEQIPIIVLTNTDKSKLGKITHRNCKTLEKKSVDPWNLVDLTKKVKRRAKFND